MKGVYSSPDSMNQRHTQQAMFPDNTYAVDSGGDPVDIPNLTFDECAPAARCVMQGVLKNVKHSAESRVARTPGPASARFSAGVRPPMKLS